MSAFTTHHGHELSEITRTSRATYERLRPLIVWLGLIELAWMTWWLLPGNAQPGYIAAVACWVVAMLAWMAIVIHYGARGFFLKHSQHLSNLVGVGLVVTFATLIAVMIPAAREGVLVAAQSASPVQLVAIHILRLLAIGTIIKYWQGELPLHFVILGSIPDFLFGVSAVAATAFVANGSVDQHALVIWHVLGLLAFAGAGVSMFFSVPSPFRLTFQQPDASIAFRFPMVLAPNFTVPLFMIAHLFALANLLGS